MDLGLSATDRIGKSDKFIVDLGLFMGFVDSKKSIDQHQQYHF